ncbi:MAG: hypothetical protein OXC18_14770 [Desulfurellaceae bacterium]|nr:hypothetical protein [Desulfurellaceae bacterium]
MRSLCLGATILGIVWFTVSVWATTVLEKSFPDLVQEADTIVVGTVTAIETEQGGEVPFTLVTFGALDIVKGSHQEDELTVSVMGGPAPDGMRLHIAGVPDFHLGDRMVVFIVGNETHAVPFVGMWQGVYRVVRDVETDTEVMADHAGRPLTAFPQRSQRGIVHDGEPSRQAQTGPALTLEAFTQSIVEELGHE